MPGLEDLQEVGRIVFRGRFEAGIDESHGAFVADNDGRETFETWEACRAEGVRGDRVGKEVPERVAVMHEESLVQGRDVLKEATEEEKGKWLGKQGEGGFSGAFGDDPARFVDSRGRKVREPGVDEPLTDGEKEHVHDPDHPSSDEDSSDDLGIQDASHMNGSDGRTSAQSVRTMESGWTGGTRESYESPSSPTSQKDVNRQNKKTEERKQRGLMQWKPARNLKFAKDEGLIGIRRLKGRLTGGLEGRQSGVETETGT